MNNIYTYAYYISTYMKIHPFVIVEYLEDAINLVTIVTNGAYQLING